MSQALERLRTLLAELFQLDQADLDFGIYRIMNARREEITRFLDQDLLPQVREAFAAYEAEGRKAKQAKLTDLIQRALDLGVDPESLPQVQDLRAELARAPDLEALEAEVYSHLYNFFRRYYQEGDFISLRRYKEGVYAIPYEGEEVKLYWANHDQYYVKTTEYLRDYSFKLPSGRRVHFKLVEADTEKDNNRAPSGSERRFILAENQPVTEDAGELVIRFEYRAHPEKAKQTDLNAEAARILLSDSGPLFASERCSEWRLELATPRPTEKNPARTLLEKHLADYTARNTFDYFIHKDLRGFLRRELDFYIKNEVMHLDDIESETAPRVEQYLAKVKALRRVAHKIIDFLAQIEDFQKKLWLKKKFVVETHYCVTLGRIFAIEDEGTRGWLLDGIVRNDAQREEWVQLHAIDELQGDLVTAGYSVPLSREFLRAYPTLMVDTRHFDEAFKLRLLGAIPDLEDEIDGLLIHSENFQALQLLQERYREQVKCVYIDPPYNTGDSEILYKNEYLSASWLSLMEDRLRLVTEFLLSDDPVLFIAIDDFEMVHLCELVDTCFPVLRREMVVVNHHPQGGKAKTLANTHEYMLVCVGVGSDRTLCGRISKQDVEYRPFKRSGTAKSNFRRGRPNSFYAILVEPKSKKVVGAEPPPDFESAYPVAPNEQGLLRVYPIGAEGEERVWRRSYESALGLIASQKLECTDSLTVYQRVEANERVASLFSNWVGPRYNAGIFGANLLANILGEHNPFPYPKSIHTVEDALFSAALEHDDYILDYFAGSGTTGHAVINLNREDGGRRRFILVEMGDYFHSVLVPRIKKVVFTPEWKDGKPKRMATPEEAERSPRVIKILRLESYEDTLNNLEVSRSKEQEALLEQHPGFREDYLLRYMLEVESRGSASLLNVAAFNDPFSYKLNIATGTAGETRPTIVDLVETFNYLIGLRVKTIEHVDGVRVVTGTNPEGERVMVLWRKVRDTDNEALDAWFANRGYNSLEQEFDVIYVNGDNNLENQRKPDQTWTVRLIEQEFQRLMFDVKDV